MKSMKEFCEMQLEILEKSDGLLLDYMIHFESTTTGQTIVNPFMSECTRFEVDPVEHYKGDYLNSDFVKMFHERLNINDKIVLDAFDGNDFGIWFPDDINNINSGCSTRGTLSEILIEYKNHLEFLLKKLLGA